MSNGYKNTFKALAAMFAFARTYVFIPTMVYILVDHSMAGFFAFMLFVTMVFIDLEAMLIEETGKQELAKEAPRRFLEALKMPEDK